MHHTTDIERAQELLSLVVRRAIGQKQPVQFLETEISETETQNSQNPKTSLASQWGISFGRHIHLP